MHASASRAALPPSAILRTTRRVRSVGVHPSVMRTPALVALALASLVSSAATAAAQRLAPGWQEQAGGPGITRRFHVAGLRDGMAIEVQRLPRRPLKPYLTAVEFRAAAANFAGEEVAPHSGRWLGDATFDDDGEQPAVAVMMRRSRDENLSTQTVKMFFYAVIVRGGTYEAAVYDITFRPSYALLTARGGEAKELIGALINIDLQENARPAPARATPAAAPTGAPSSSASSAPAAPLASGRSSETAPPRELTLPGGWVEQPVNPEAPGTRHFVNPLAVGHDMMIQESSRRAVAGASVTAWLTVTVAAEPAPDGGRWPGPGRLVTSTAAKAKWMRLFLLPDGTAGTAWFGAASANATEGRLYLMRWKNAQDSDEYQQVEAHSLLQARMNLEAARVP